MDRGFQKIKLYDDEEQPSSPPQHRAAVSAACMKEWIKELVPENMCLFTPAVIQAKRKKFSFKASCAGRFCCCVTGLTFVLEASGEVTYGLSYWEEAPHLPGAWSPAGPLFNIERPQGILKELHLPHCEMVTGENLSVAHVTDGNMEILQPLAVTKTRVIILISSLSIFGLIKKKILPKVRGQVLLLLRPVQNILNVFLLPLNMPPEQVYEQEQQKGNIIIPTSSTCLLVRKQRYRMNGDRKAIRKIQPKSEKFESSFARTIYPTFELFLENNLVEMELSILEHPSGEPVWNRTIPLKDADPPSSSRTSMDDVSDYSRRCPQCNARSVAFVNRHREAIIQRGSVIEPILDQLYRNVTLEHYDYVRAAETCQNKMRRLYQVMNSNTLKTLFFDALKKMEPHLVTELEGS